MSNPEINYQISPSLLNAFQSYLDSESIYLQYWGASENPSMTESEFEQKQFQSLLDSLNRVPHEPSEPAEKGTAFNEVVDCIIEKRKSDKMEIKVIRKQIPNPNYSPDFDNYGRPTIEVDSDINVKLNGFEFTFPVALCKEFASYFDGAITQVRVDGILPTKYGNVNLYGYIDELMPLSVHDIKTTSKYSAGKFRRTWQHYVYPYCLLAMGNDIRTFEYNVTDFKNTYTEMYVFNPEIHVPELKSICEQLILFAENNRNLLTHPKFFNKHEQK